MRVILILIALSFLGIIAMGTFFYITASIKKLFNIKKAESREFASKMATKKFTKADVPPSVNQTIDLSNSLSVTQYGNDVLKNIGDMSNFMYQLTENSLLDKTATIIQDIIKNKSKRFNHDDFVKHSFLTNYTKDRLVQQVINIEENIKRYEHVFKDFDRIIKSAESVVVSFKPVISTDVYEIEQINTKKANVNLLKNKIVNLKTSKLYHQQSISQLKVMLSLNNNLIVEFDNIIHQMLPLMKNNASIESMKSFDMNGLSNYVEQIKKISLSRS